MSKRVSHNDAGRVKVVLNSGGMGDLEPADTAESLLVSALEVRSDKAHNPYNNSTALVLSCVLHACMHAQTQTT